MPDWLIFRQHCHWPGSGAAVKWRLQTECALLRRSEQSMPDPNRQYFGHNRGITWYNFMSDQYSGFHGIVIPGTMRDSIFVLEGLLEQETGLNPSEIMTDTPRWGQRACLWPFLAAPIPVFPASG